jgi:hypothetical protein
MNYTNFYECIGAVYNIDPVGWTLPFVNPSNLSDSIPPLVNFRDALIAGTCYFKKLTPQDAQERAVKKSGAAKSRELVLDDLDDDGGNSVQGEDMAEPTPPHPRPRPHPRGATQESSELPDAPLPSAGPLGDISNVDLNDDSSHQNRGKCKCASQLDEAEPLGGEVTLRRGDRSRTKKVRTG